MKHFIIQIERTERIQSMSRAGVLFFRHVFESGDRKKIAKQPSDVSDLHIIRDIPYLNDNEQGHLLDIYSLTDAPDDAPVMINIHGGGLPASLIW